MDCKEIVWYNRRWLGWKGQELDDWDEGGESRGVARLLMYTPSSYDHPPGEVSSKNSSEDLSIVGSVSSRASSFTWTNKLVMVMISGFIHGMFWEENEYQEDSVTVMRVPFREHRCTRSNRACRRMHAGRDQLVSSINQGLSGHRRATEKASKPAAAGPSLVRRCWMPTRISHSLNDASIGKN